MREAERGTRPARWLAAATRAGHAAKGTIYAATAALGLWRAVSGAGEASGAREAVRAIAEVPFGKAVIAILAAGVAAFALSRLTLALLDPDGAGWRRRALNLMRAVFNAALVVSVVHLVLGGEATVSEAPTRLARALARPRGRWIVAAFGAGLLVLGVQRLANPRGEDLPGRARSPGLPNAAAWITWVGSAARVARGTTLLAIGGGMVYAAAVRAPTAGPPWISGVLGGCLLVLAANEWTRARCSLPAPRCPGDQPAGGAHVSDSTGGACV